MTNLSQLETQKNPTAIRTVLGAAALVLSLGSQALAVSWDPANNPNNFNQPWHPTQYDYNADRLKLTGELEENRTPWSDSYWPKQRGAMTYRWQMYSTPTQDQHLTEADRQRLFFNYKLHSLSELKKMSAQEIDKLSPLEKYSIFIGDYNYRIVKKYRAKNSASNEYWEGYCHAWSGAALHYSEPKPVVVTNDDKIQIPFGSGDIKAILTANYADRWGVSVFNVMNGRKKSAQVGNVCRNSFQFPTTKIKKGKEVLTDYGDTEGQSDTALEFLVQQYQENATRVISRDKGMDWIRENDPDLLDPNFASRSRQGAMNPACADTNAGAFHVVIGNQLGNMREGFSFDKTRDAEIWNQPAYKYESKVVSDTPVNYTVPRGKGLARVTKLREYETKLYYADDTDYGWSFYFPTLSKLFSHPADDFMREYDRYQQLLLNEGDITERETYPESILASADYRYNVELDSKGDIVGGNWITLDRPDFLWIMQPLAFEGDFSGLNQKDINGKYIYPPLYQPE
jgi:hypothetical protein